MEETTPGSASLLTRDVQLSIPMLPEGPSTFGVWFHAQFGRLAGRGRCGQCGQRRVLFTIWINGVAQGRGQCAVCTRIRA